MGIVNPSEVHPGIFRAIYRLCNERGPEFAATPDEFVALLAPTAAVNEGADPSLSARLSVKEAQAIGMLTPLPGDANRYCLALPAPPESSDVAAAEAFFACELRRLVLAPQNNADLFGEEHATDEGAERERDERLSTGLAREFTRIQAWLLLQDPTGGSLFFTHKDPRRNVQRLQDRYDGADLVRNNNRWTTFRRWSLFLGYSRQDHLAGSKNAGLVPDPTRAVRDQLDTIRSETTQMPLVKLRDLLAERIPFLDGGTYREEVQRHVGGADDPGTASAALALALLRCERASLLQFERKADFSGGTLTIGQRPYTHALIGGA